MTAPYYPTALATPVINPKVGGFIRPVPYLSPSQYRYAPTAMDTESLDTLANAFGQPTEADQIQVLANIVYRASEWIDSYLFGVAPASKGASLCASQSVEDARVRFLKNQLRLPCSYGPILQLDAVAVGADPSSVTAVAQNVAAQATFGTRTIYLPGSWPLSTQAGPQLSVAATAPDGKCYAVWTYTNGYPHLELAATANSGQNHVQVIANGPNSTVLGVYAGDVLTIDDYVQAETLTVQSVSGTTITFTTNLSATHTVPTAPDFIAVTALPGEVTQAAIFMVTALIKSRGDLSLTLQGVTEPKNQAGYAFNLWSDVMQAKDMLCPYKTVTKYRS